jgi:YfiH family protein
MMMVKASEHGVQVCRFPHFSVPHGVGARSGGVSSGRFASLNLGPLSGDDRRRVRLNRDRFLGALGLGDAPVVAPRQVHGARVTAVRRGDAAAAGGVVDGDAVVSDVPGLTVMLLAADCAPILLHDPSRGVVAAVHAGWRGTALSIAPAAVRLMREQFGCRPADIRAGIGPAIGRCCYEVGPEVISAVGRATPGGAAPLCEPLPRGKAMLDLTAAIVAQLAGAGLDPANIETAGLCTACRTDLFYSHRREGEPTGRNGTAIALPDTAEV